MYSRVNAYTQVVEAAEALKLVAGKARKRTDSFSRVGQQVQELKRHKDTEEQICRDMKFQKCTSLVVRVAKPCVCNYALAHKSKSHRRESVKHSKHASEKAR